MNNLKLKKEIISHIFHTVGIFTTGNNAELISHILDKQFLLDKKLAFEIDDEKYEKSIHAMYAKMETSEIKILAADTTNEIREFTLIIQMDKSYPCALRLSEDVDDSGSISFCIENNKWIEAGTILQAKILMGVESLSGLFLNWKKINDYGDIYKSLVGFLNYFECYEGQ
jgi:hypothetical protein